MSVRAEEDANREMRRQLSALYRSMDGAGRSRMTKALHDIKLARELREAGVAS